MIVTFFYWAGAVAWLAVAVGYWTEFMTPRPGWTGLAAFLLSGYLARAAMDKDRRV